jgi:hypothetical protein
MKLRVIFTSLVLILIMGACSTPQKTLPVRHVNDMGQMPVSEGFFYMLPRTVVTVDIAVTRVESTPGPFADYAGRYLGLDDVITRPSASYSISNVNISSYVEADPGQVYFVPFNALQRQDFFVSLSESGLIRSINTPFDNNEFIKSLSQTYDYGLFGSSVTFNSFIEHNLRERIDTITERVRIDTMTVERQTLRRSWVEKSTDIRAKEVADYILRLREKKLELISGIAEIPYSKEAIEYMYTEMNKLEEDYLLLFRGITNEAVINYRFTMIPESSASDDSFTLFRFSPREGVLEADRRDGYPVRLEMFSNNVTKLLPHLSQNQDEGFFYRIPENADLILYEGNNVRARSRMLINQFGVVSRMAPASMQLEFYPNTGSVKSIGRIESDRDN